ncbi:LANO_0B04126g1_1 [Lachancea nothofagi CBS 11611]|uniref:LANO_0B04126g1_1 n=1 Tax=Lachancea nothofagi CBS 11611 TaxID=1266666 RepID=A0A1G4IXX1_9SACH|nr:LANO_0B04126g1_1 [Lachancea nothofagi CBS 11611]
MERRVHELEDRYVRVYRELLKALDELYLYRQRIVPKDESVLAVRRQLQSSMTMTAPMIQAMGNDGELELRLRELMRENYEMDETFAEHQNEHIRLLNRLSEKRSQYEKLVATARPIAAEIRKLAPRSHPGIDGVDKDVKDENEVLKELIVGMIIQSGYQGTNRLISEWLEYLGNA